MRPVRGGQSGHVHPWGRFAVELAHVNMQVTPKIKPTGYAGEAGQGWTLSTLSTPELVDGA